MDLQTGIEAGKIAVESIEKGSNLLNITFKWGKCELQKLNVDFGGAFVNYLEEAPKKYGKVKTILLAQPQNLYDFFVANPLMLNGEEIAIDDINNVLKISNYILILGDGALGKSTLMKHFFMSEVQKGDLIPVFIELKDINSFDGDFIEFIHNRIEKHGFYSDINVFKHALSKGRFLFIFDGYDEVISNKFDHVYTEIDLLCDRYPNNFYVITSRKCRDFKSLRRFTEFEVSPFSKERALELVRKLNYNKELQDKFAIELENNLYKRHNTFLSNPLLLSMMLLTYDKYADIPIKLYKFYANAFDAIYIYHDAGKHFKREIKSGLDEDSFRKALSHFCFSTYFEQKVEFTRDEIRNRITAVNNKHFNENPFNVDDFIHDLFVAVCVIYQDGLDYKFTHRSFQEYFTAVLINSLDDERQKKLYIRLHDNQKIVASDGVMKMLMEMNPDRFDKNFSIPILKSLNELYFDSKTRVQKRHELIYYEISARFYDENNKSLYMEELCDYNFEDVLPDCSNIIMGYLISNDYFFKLELFFRENYTSYFNFAYSKRGKVEKIFYEMCKQNQTEKRGKGDYYFLMENIHTNTALKDAIIESDLMVPALKYLLSDLEKKTKKLNAEFDDLF